ncbi:hypothetical protein E4U13_001069 [Claviceps humidiphila]|uniref:NmrA-like domain-containing protein n=1 Tax=Claviceps humidiphila TaxID=1294629 RepID=A0A9P7Q0Q7_9HYPO|nr:hypothetical protein E4U13_001069 [Claviceps humidiphila]UFQ31883.1 agroclavine dehydrogenase [Claviceps humidiphila]
MTVLLTGGTGRTARNIAGIFRQTNVPFLVASRASIPETADVHRKFDWLDEETFPNALSVDQGMKPVSVVWLCPPPLYDLATPVNSFVDFAVSQNVKKFVLLSASVIDKGGPAMGKIHAHLDSIPGVTYTVLRPTWFMENFSTKGEIQCEAIKRDGTVYSATGDGKIPFISVTDVARVAACALTAETLKNSDHILLGPDLLSYDEVAQGLTGVLGRKITHTKMSEGELAEKLMEENVTPEEAYMHAAMDSMIKSGSEARKVSDEVRVWTGVEPRGFINFALSAKAAWRSRK